ncbi:MAG: site-2 protease family protein [Candidatus Liptonbacteria bacterium]|nr:site-2 protease family protein [Candidatus Liptonbacteria bacterium]
MDSILILIFQLIVLIFSVMVHEVSHGYVAERLGDPTARLAGRLTLNPLRHLDPFGSFLLPLGLYILTRGSFVFGWAKPVPYNPLNLKNPRTGAATIAAAGPLSNLILAGVFGILLRIFAPTDFAPSAISLFFSLIIYLNILLAVFNLVPIPPLDGSKVLFAFLGRGEGSHQFMSFLERYGFLFLLIFIFYGFRLIIPIINTIYFFLAGEPFG